MADHMFFVMYQAMHDCTKWLKEHFYGILNKCCGIISPSNNIWKMYKIFNALCLDMPTVKIRGNLGQPHHEQQQLLRVEAGGDWKWCK